MRITPVPAFTDNYIWTLVNDKKRCFCVDPGDAKPVQSYIHQNQLTLEAILLTHHHYDHIGGVDALLSDNPHLIIYGPEDSRITQITHPLGDGDTINIDTLTFDVMAIPGHTSSHIAYYNADQKILFCGDTLFSAGCGRVFDGTMDDLFQSLSKINQLPPDTKIYCAHEYTLNNCQFAKSIEQENQILNQTIQKLEQLGSGCSLPSTLQLEQSINPFIRAINQTLISPELQHLSGFELFRQLRKMKDAF